MYVLWRVRAGRPAGPKYCIVRSEKERVHVVFVERYQMHLIYTYQYCKKDTKFRRGQQWHRTNHLGRRKVSRPQKVRFCTAIVRIGKWLTPPWLFSQCNNSCWPARITALSLVIGQDTPWKEFSGIFLWRRRVGLYSLKSLRGRTHICVGRGLDPAPLQSFVSVRRRVTSSDMQLKIRQN
jgi:hypothetical protein